STEIRASGPPAALRCTGSLRVIAASASPAPWCRAAGYAWRSTARDRRQRPAPARRGPSLEIVKRSGRSGSCLIAAQERALIGAGNAVEEIGNVAWIRISFVEGVRKQGACQRPLLRVCPLGKAGELLGVLVVERDVQP